ncbi:MAG: urea ABC transporter permease subunit UrtB [Nevskia sp.]|nr:urea ABC transporter permease subunit UrtB [Nevskia sp.]
MLLVLLALCLLWMSTARADDAAPLPVDFPGLVAALPQADFAAKQAIVTRMTELHVPQARVLLAAWLDNRLESRRSDGKVFVVEEHDGTLVLVDPFDGKGAGEGAADDFERVRSNNALRKLLKVSIAQFDLKDPDPRVRAAAVRQMRRDLDEDTVTALRAALTQEKDGRAQHEIRVALAVSDLGAGDAAVRLAAVRALDGETAADVYNALKPLAQDSGTESDASMRAAAIGAVRHIEVWRNFYEALETLFFGLSLGSVLVLAAIGLAITFGVMGVINMAHGELMMLGAYTAYVMQQLMPHHVGAALLLSVPAAFLVSGLAGVAIERTVVRYLYGRPLETLLATFGLSLIMQQLVRSVFSPLNRSVATPEWMSGLWQVNDLFSLTWNRVYILVFSLVVFLLLVLILNRTPLGLKVRAVAQNRGMARAMGVRTERVDALTFGLGSGIAGVAGVALSQLTNVGPNLGQSYIVDSFMVVVFGGVGNLWGTLISGMGLGVVNKLLEPYAGAVIAKILVLVFLIMFIQRRPRGLFPQKGRAAEGT